MGGAQGLILLDTHTLVWYVNEDPQMPAGLWQKINSENPILVSAISAWEMALLVQKERLLLNIPVEDWIKTATKYFPLTWIDLSAEICLKSTQLPGDFHQDPADRFIAATCILNNATLVTKDKRLQKYSFVKTIWDSK